MQHLVEQNWHSIPSNEIVEILQSDIHDGLGPLSIKHKTELFGKNILENKKGSSLLEKFFIQFHNALIYILLAASLVTAYLGEWIDSIVIFSVVIINVIIGFVQEVKAQEAIDSLKNMMTTEAVVIRDGKKISISSVDLVPGDIVLLESGSKIPADIRILTQKDIKVDESMLTGESVSVSKNTELCSQDVTLNDRKNMLYSGTFVTYGRAKGIVVAISKYTQIGKIADLIDNTVSLETPLTKKISYFSKVLLILILILAGLTFLVGIVRENSIIDTFMASVALAVGAIPEGLPAAVTITLAIGVSRMAKKNSIIRKLPAVETLGSVTTICSDKTGTLTQNKMTVINIFCGKKSYEITGNGYEPKGNFLLDGEIITDYPLNIKEVLQAGYLCNESYLVLKDEIYSIKGDPTEGALIVSCLKAGYDEHSLENTFPRIDILPFESDKQYMATLHQDQQTNQNTVFIKGSVEKILEICDFEMLDSSNIPINIDSIYEQVNQYATEGLRVLALAKKTTRLDTIDTEELMNGFTFLGLQAMMDPPRDEAIDAVKKCHNAGINIIMITGDHALTAFSIAKMITIVPQNDSFEKSVLTGKELFTLNDEELIEKVAKVKVFARVEPEQKLRIVDALQARGEIVAMTGDGVNDAPALKQANIGIAMGQGGTEVAKEAADMILSDDNFSSIERAVKEGRNVFDNLVKFITWTLPTNLGEGLVILFSIMLGVTLPILPLQILWINMSTAIFLGLMLVFEPSEKNIMNRAPRDPKEPLMTKVMVTQMLVVGLYMLVASYTMFNYMITLGYTVEYARTVAVNIFVFIELFYLFSCKQLELSIFKTNILDNKLLLVGVSFMVFLQLVFTHTSFMNNIFKSEPLNLETWVAIIVISFCVVFVVEIKKIIELKINRF